MEAEPATDRQTVHQVSVKSEPLSIEIDDAQLLGVPEPAATGDVVLEMKPTVVTSVVSMIGSGEKRKRGRPPRGQSAASRPTLLPKVTQEDEDVCFICFDGGSLVLCDKKGCPKVYHPTCIKRDEAFFRSKAKWNCGWHICSVCQKASHYMCYTCTYSLCKGCTMDRDYVCVRGNMGFCSTCMRTIMLIESKDHANRELVQVDFDDKTSWEYLFKVYWVYLKERLSLTLDELTQAENPCKGVRSLACKRMLPDLHNGVSNRNGFLSNTSCEQLDSNDLVETPIKDTVIEENSIKFEEKLSNENDASSIVCNVWASKELLDFVAHMKQGDESMLSQFDVQELLLKYIKKNNLRDPLKKSQIICDLRLMNLFGKTRVGHIEMLKLLEFHFLFKEDLQNNFIPAGIIGTDASHLDAEENNKSSLTTNKSKQRKSRKRIEVRTAQNDLEEYAAIDVHNVNLIYLRRNLMENLTRDEKFLEKVIGSVVRIRISSSDQKPDIYRLVQVVGTKKVPAAYKVGNKTVDVVLQVLNLNKKESIAIDSISNQDFSQDECRRLRQSIRCGLVKHLTVGDIQKKAMELLTARLDDWLEAEKLKLNHLRDRASEKGRKKDLRECVEKLQRLDTPEERQRRLSEIPEVHADAKMNPDYESEQDAGVGDEKQDEYARSKHSEFGRSKHRQINGKRKVRDDGIINSQRGIAQKRCASKLSDQAGVRPVPEIPAAILSTGSSSPANDGETEKLWHYRDPNGNVQGPFSVVQLRKWSTTGYFPPNMRIWRNHEQKDSVLLTDALNGQFPAAPHMLYNLSLQSKQIRPASDNQISDAKWNHGTEIHRRQCNRIVHPLQYGIAGTQLDDNNECKRIDVSGSLSSGFSASSYLHKEIQPKDFPHIELKENKFPSIHTGVRHPIPSSSNGPLVSNHHGVQGYGNVGTPLRSAIQIVDGHSGEKKYNKSHQIQSSLQNGISLPANLNSTEMDLNSGSPLVNAGSCKETCNTRPCESLNSTVKVISQELEFVADLKLQSLNPKVPPQASNIPSLPSPTPELPNPQASDIPSLPSPTPQIPNENQGGQIAESKQPQPGNGMFQDSGSDWSSGSSLVVGSTQLPEKTDDKGKRSPMASAGSCGETCNREPHGTLNSALKVNIQELEFDAAVELQSLNSKVPPQDSDIPSLPSPTPEILNENQGGQIAESKQPQPGNGMFQDSTPSWSSGSSLVVGSTHLLDKMGDRGGHSPLANSSSCGETCNTEPLGSHNSPLKVNSRELEFVDSVESLNSKVHLQASDIPSLPSPTPQILNESQGGQIAESKQPQPGNGMFQDSSLSWCSGSSVVSTQLPDKTDDWAEHSPTRAKPVVEEWSSGLVSVSLLKQPEVVGDHATPTSNDETLVHDSPSHITSNVTSWHGVETIEFSTLGEESVSDLLDEVDAMESRRGLGSPSSTMRCVDAIKGFKDDCFFIDDLSMTLDPGKGDAWSSTGDIQVSFQSIAMKDTCGVSGSDAYDHLKRSSGHSSTSSDGETRYADISHNQAEAGLASHKCPSRDISQGLNGTMPPDNRLEVLENVTKKSRDHLNLAVEPSPRRVVDVSWDSNQGTGRGTISNYGGHQLDGHETYGGGRHHSS